MCIVTSDSRSCNESQLALMLVVLISQLLGNVIAILYPMLPREAAEWFAAAAYLTMTFSIAMVDAIIVSGSILQFLFEADFGAIGPDQNRGIVDTSGEAPI